MKGSIDPSNFFSILSDLAETRAMLMISKGKLPDGISRFSLKAVASRIVSLNFDYLKLAAKFFSRN